MTAITPPQYESLVKGIYDSIMASEEMGLGDVSEAKTEAERIVDDWMEANNIELQ